jgi:hypothetical protein
MADKTLEQRVRELDERLGDRRYPRATATDLKPESDETATHFAVRFDGGGTSYFDTYEAAHQFAAYGTRAPCIVAEWRDGHWYEWRRFV